MSVTSFRLGCAIVICGLLTACGDRSPSPAAGPELVLTSNAQDPEEVAQISTQVSNKTTQEPAVLILVLPFTRLSNGADDEYFTTGLSAEIIRAISLVAERHVARRTSAFQFNPASSNSDDFAIAFGASHLLTGTAAREASRLRVTARLTRVAAREEQREELWAKTYDVGVPDSPNVIANIGWNVIETLASTAEPALEGQLLAGGIPDSRAMIAFEIGNEQVSRAYADAPLLATLRRANGWFEQALNIHAAFVAAYEQHSRLFEHILMASSSGELEGDISDAQIQAAPAQLSADIAAVLRFARTSERQTQAQLDFNLLARQARGLVQLTEASLQDGSCTMPRWITLVTAAFDQAEALVTALQDRLRCDPLAGSIQADLIRAAVWRGGAAPSPGIESSTFNRADSEGVAAAQVAALAATGQFDRADDIATSNIRQQDKFLMTRVLLSAARGDGHSAMEFQQRFLNQHGPSDRLSLLFAAWRGDRNDANQLAARIDPRPFGHINLLQTILQCNCGAPFDLQATPVLKEFLTAANLPWPPRSPITFPLKNW